MKTSVLIITFFISSFCFSQITQYDLSKLKNAPKSYKYQLDILDQKLDGDVFKTNKHKRYVVDIIDNKISTQKVFDTINNSFNKNRSITYKNNTNNVIQKVTDLKGNIIKTIKLEYNNENNLLYETTFNESDTEVQKISYNYDTCKPTYIADLLDDSSSQNPDRIFKCTTKTTVKKISNYTFSKVSINKIGVGEVKKIDLKGDKDSPIIRFYTIENKDNSKQTSLHKNDKVKVYNTSKFDIHGNVIYIKSGYSELFYTYKYDESNNWIEKIETSKVKSKRRVFKQTITY